MSRLDHIVKVKNGGRPDIRPGDTVVFLSGREGTVVDGRADGDPVTVLSASPGMQNPVAPCDIPRGSTVEIDTGNGLVVVKVTGPDGMVLWERK